MSNITITPNLGTTIGAAADTSQNPQSTKTQSPAPTPPASSPTDNITLSLGAQANTAGTTASQTLSDSAASAQSYELRQQLSSAPLSGTARQNQAIVALLR